MTLEDAIKAIEHRERRDKAIRYLQQAIKYLFGYLDDYTYKVEKDFAGDPIVLTIKIYINETVEKVLKEVEELASGTVEERPPETFESMEKMEEEGVEE